MAQRQRFNNRRVAKLDAYATADLQREHGLSFPVVKLLQDLAIHADFRDFILRTSHTDLHELTGMTRRTIKGYLAELESRGLLKMTSAPVGQRGIHIDTSPVYNLIIVDNDTSNFRKSGLQKDSSRTASSSTESNDSLDQKTQGSEVVRLEEGEAVQGSLSSCCMTSFQRLRILRLSLVRL